VRNATGPEVPPNAVPVSAVPPAVVPPAVVPPNVEVRRSPRRRRTVSAYRDGDRTIVLVPARMSRADERRWVDVMLERLAAQEQRRAGKASRNDDALARRAAELSGRYLRGRATPASVRWVGNQASRWGSCTPADSSIRLSDRMKAMPAWVIDYVLLHELAHLIEIGHGPRFQSLVAGYPKAEVARGYLLGFSDGAGVDQRSWEGADEPDLPAGPLQLW
jgi:predicted metal-dependent hydrolase